MSAIVLDPVGDRLYFSSPGGVEAINVDGSNRTKLADNFTISLAVDVKQG